MHADDAEYFSDVTGQLAQMARVREMVTLAYLLDIAQLEAMTIHQQLTDRSAKKAE